MRFTHCFANPLCSPSRGQLRTGRYPFQNGLKVVLHSTNQEDLYLKPSQPSFPRQLKAHGYAAQTGADRFDEMLRRPWECSELEMELETAMELKELVYFRE